MRTAVVSFLSNEGNICACMYLHLYQFTFHCEGTQQRLGLGLLVSNVKQVEFFFWAGVFSAAVTTCACWGGAWLFLLSLCETLTLPLCEDTSSDDDQPNHTSSTTLVVLLMLIWYSIMEPIKIS